MSTVTKSPAKKSAKVENVFILAMMSAIEDLKTLPPAPEFAEESIRAGLNASGLPADYIDKAIRDLRYRHEVTHGDNSAKSAQVILSKLTEAMGEDGVETVAKLAKAIASGPRKPRVELTDAQKEEVKALRLNGMQKSEIVTKFNVSDATVHNLCAGIIPMDKTAAK